MCGARNSHNTRHDIVKGLFICTEVMFRAYIQTSAPDVLCAISPGGKEWHSWILSIYNRNTIQYKYIIWKDNVFQAGHAHGMWISTEGFTRSERCEGMCETTSLKCIAVQCIYSIISNCLLRVTLGLISLIVYSEIHFLYDWMHWCLKLNKF